jgi:acetoin utilization protein AcuC
VDVVPRVWTHLLAEAAGHPIAPGSPIPAEWLAFARAVTGRPAMVSTMTDGRNPVPRPWSSGYDPADPVDRAVMLTRRAVFPLHGLYAEP